MAESGMSISDDEFRRLVRALEVLRAERKQVLHKAVCEVLKIEHPDAGPADLVAHAYEKLTNNQTEELIQQLTLRSSQLGLLDDLSATKISTDILADTNKATLAAINGVDHQFRPAVLKRVEQYCPVLRVAPTSLGVRHVERMFTEAEMMLERLLSGVSPTDRAEILSKFDAKPVRVNRNGATQLQRLNQLVQGQLNSVEKLITFPPSEISNPIAAAGVLHAFARRLLSGNWRNFVRSDVAAPTGTAMNTPSTLEPLRKLILVGIWETYPIFLSSARAANIDVETKELRQAAETSINAFLGSLQMPEFLTIDYISQLALGYATVVDDLIGQIPDGVAGKDQLIQSFKNSLAYEVSKEFELADHIPAHDEILLVIAVALEGLRYFEQSVNQVGGSESGRFSFLELQTTILSKIQAPEQTWDRSTLSSALSGWLEEIRSEVQTLVTHRLRNMRRQQGAPGIRLGNAVEHIDLAGRVVWGGTWDFIYESVMHGQDSPLPRPPKPKPLTLPLSPLMNASFDAVKNILARRFVAAVDINERVGTEKLDELIDTHFRFPPSATNFDITRDRSAVELLTQAVESARDQATEFAADVRAELGTVPNDFDRIQKEALFTPAGLGEHLNPATFMSAAGLVLEELVRSIGGDDIQFRKWAFESELKLASDDDVLDAYSEIVEALERYLVDHITIVRAQIGSPSLTLRNQGEAFIREITKRPDPALTDPMALDEWFRLPSEERGPGL